MKFCVRLLMIQQLLLVGFFTDLVSGQDSADVEGFELKPSVQTRPKARTFDFTVPAPRGRILDRNGRVLANSKISHYLAVQLPSWEGADQTQTIALVQLSIKSANRALNTNWKVTDDQIIQHYRHRRWFPLRISPKPLTDAQQTTLTKSVRIISVNSITPAKERIGLTFEPVYIRTYPEGKVAGHLIGYVGRETPLEKAAIVKNELLFENLKGRAGLEKSFDSELTGKDGIFNYTFDELGNLVEKRAISPAVPGNDIITTLNLDLQILAEAQLADKSKRGSAVVVNSDSGDILALASYPGFDPNLFVPYISSAEFNQLNNDLDKPLFNRAISAAYPPGSTFKPFVACAVLTNGPVRPWTRYPGPPTLWVGDRFFKNWNTEDEGSLTVIEAIKRSTNTWFYQAAINTGSAPIINTAAEFGFGSSTNLPLAGESPGNLPKTLDLPAGRTANISIGQGEILSTPVQLAMATAAIANGRHYPEARLVSQVQNIDQQVIKEFPGKSRGFMPYAKDTIQAVQEGMDEVVNGDRGTARRAILETVRLAGKTGTAQWSSGDGQPRNLAWFSGFTFTKNPQLAFAVVYEGELGETVSGGRTAAPIAAGILAEVYAQPEAFAFAKPEILPAPKLQYTNATPVRAASAERVSTDQSVAGATVVRDSNSALKTQPTRSSSPQIDNPVPFPETERRKPIRSIVKGLFGRNR